MLDRAQLQVHGQGRREYTLSRQPETIFKEKVYKRLDKIPDLFYEKIQQVALRGTPDIIGCYQGFYFAFELKVGKNKADALQRYTLGKIGDAGGLKLTVYPKSLDQAIERLLAWPGDYKLFLCGSSTLSPRSEPE